MQINNQKAATARKLLKEFSMGVLSTHSADVDGYPFGSVVEYLLDQYSQPIILISELAQHTRNIKRDQKVCLTIFDPNRAEPLSAGRLAWIGEAEKVGVEEEPKLKTRYLRYFPTAADYFAMDFALYRIKLRRARFIAGFGQIFWVEPDEMLFADPLSESEDRIVDHMNEDHSDSLLHYCRAIKGLQLSESETVLMSGIDSEGFDMLVANKKVRIVFDAPIKNPKEAREVLVKLAKANL